MNTKYESMFKCISSSQIRHMDMFSSQNEFEGESMDRFEELKEDRDIFRKNREMKMKKFGGKICE